MLKSSVSTAFATIALLIGLMAGCKSGAVPAPVSDAKPLTTPPPVSLSIPSSQPSELVAELGPLGVSRAELDSLLYESYGLRMMFDLVELELAKSTLLAEQKETLNPADVERERQIIMTKMMADAAPSDYDNLFEQFLQREHISRAEFEIKVVQTDACLRKIIEPIVLGKIPDDKVHAAFEQLYGGQRVIADITLPNVREATRARERCRTEPFAKVANDMSLDRETAVNGGVWPPFSAQASQGIPAVIVQAAFTTAKDQISDILQTSTNCHIIKVLQIIPPKIVKYDDVKDSVRKQLEDQLVESDIKKLREALTSRAQASVKIDDPILKAQWDEMLAKSRAKTNDPATIKQEMDEKVKQQSAPIKAPATEPFKIK